LLTNWTLSSRKLVNSVSRCVWRRLLGWDCCGVFTQPRPKAAPNFSGFSCIWTAAVGKSGHSAGSFSNRVNERPLYPRNRTFR